MLHPKSTLNCNGQLIDLSEPIIMGVLNVTPDSFFDGGKYENVKALLQQVGKMISAGAMIIDVGGMSSRPGAEIINVSEELSRVIPIIKQIKEHFPTIIISIDTVRSEVARQSVAAGASIINDISAGSIDDQMFETVAELNVPYILMHMQGKPENMQQHPDYQDVTKNVLDFFIEKIGELRELGVKDIILDPGFGFGKTIQHNYQLLQNFAIFKILDLSLLAGISRKSMIYKVLDSTPEEALNGTTVLNTLALERGAKILRVHDVKEAKETITLWKQLNQEPKKL
ncbi:MAG: dihydropteroate synthase [Granulosicoccus sp.]|jgi:dihydropteroate synthase